MRRGILTIAVVAILGVALVQESPNDGAANEGAALEVRTEPQQALVSVSGPEGFVSMLDVSGSEVLSGLEAGRYIIVATAEGRSARYVEVELAQGAKERVTISLEPVSGQQPQGQPAEGGGQAAQQSQPSQAAQQQQGQGQQSQQQGEQQGQTAGGGQAAESGQQGDTLYAQHCAVCHGAQGEGGVGPALAGNQFMQNAQAVVTQILQGGGGMPGFADQLTDEEVAAVATHEMNSWGNDFGQVTPRLVSEIRGGGQPQGQQSQQQAQGGQAQSQQPEQQQPAQQPTQQGQQQAQGGQAQAAGGGQSAQSGQGGQIYSQQCASCHGPQGGGGAGPALAGNQTLQNHQAVISQILNGGGGMPAFGNQLSDAQIAAVATHEMNSWGNSFGQVSAQQVTQVRGGGQVQQQQQGQQPGQPQGQAQQGQTQGQQQTQQGQPMGQTQQQGAQGQQAQVTAQQMGNQVRIEITVPANAVPLRFTIDVEQAGQSQGQSEQVSGQQSQSSGQQQSQQQGQQLPGQPQQGQQSGQQAQGQQQTGQQQGQQQTGQQQTGQGQQQISFTQAQSQQGGQEYFEHCAVCHGNDLLGRASYPPVAGEEFLSEWQGRSVQELFDFVSTRMPQDRPGTLGHQTYVDLTAFLLQQYGLTPGQQALQPAEADLASVQLPPPSGQPGVPPGDQGAAAQEGPPEGDQEGQPTGQGQQQNE